MLKQICALRPLEDFPFTVNPVTEDIASIGLGWYVLIGTRQLSDGIPDDTVRTCLIIWAVDVNSAILVSRCENESVQLSDGTYDLPPVDHFVQGVKSWKYGDLIKIGKKKSSECGVYGFDGKFLFKELSLAGLCVYFRSRSRTGTELPFAISLRNFASQA